MERHLLLTISDDLSLLCGVRFAASFFRNTKQTKLTLLYVAPGFESVSPHADHVQHEMDRKQSRIYREKGQMALNASQKYLTERGFPPANIATRLISKRFGTVEDIIFEGRGGHFDAVILGRRGYTLFEKAFANSVSREIMNRDIDFPVWVCRQPEGGRRNVLLCVDETEPSLRIADHVGFILEAEAEHAVTLFHVDLGEGKNADTILQHARQKLVDNRVPEERIRSRIVRASKVVKPIVEEVERGGYAAVAVGRGGTQAKGLLDKWLGGSRSMELLEILDKAALWVSK
jgi:nucleotide-binding universal stress UspA family protein